MKIFSLTSDYSPAGDQSNAITLLNEGLDDGLAQQTLLGVTGSGKTEVYFEIIEEVVKKNKQVLIMVPEISLTPQLESRFLKRFGISPDIWHSKVSNKNKMRAIIKKNDLKNSICQTLAS